LKFIQARYESLPILAMTDKRENKRESQKCEWNLALLKALPLDLISI
jgi:hypothetical protein